jgi:hypothetical protein
MSKKVTALKFCLICTIILRNSRNVLIIKVKLLMIGFIVLLTSCLIPRMLSISALTKSINFINIETFELLYHIFYTEFMVLLRVFGALYYLNLFPCQIIYSNWRLLNLARGLNWLRLIAIYFLLKTPFSDFLIVIIRFFMPSQLLLPSLI